MSISKMNAQQNLTKGTTKQNKQQAQLQPFAVYAK
jgi:hypothetical protein